MGNKPATTTTTTSQSRAPWSPTQQPLTNIVGQASNLAGDLSNFTPQYSASTFQGIQGLQDAAANGSQAQAAYGQIVPGSTQGFNTGLGQLQGVASGQYLNSNQYLDPVLQRVLQDTADKTNSQFTAGGRYGSGAHAQTLARNLSQADANLRMANYGQERANQDAAAGTLYRGGFTGAGMGGAADQAALWAPNVNLQAGSLQDQIANAQRLAPMQALDWQAGITNPIAQQGGTTSGTTQSQTVQPVNKTGQILGGAMMGAGLLAAPFTGGASLGLVGSGAGLMSGQGGGGSGGGMGGLSGLFGGGSGSGSSGGGGDYGYRLPGGGYEVHTPAGWGVV